MSHLKNGESLGTFSKWVKNTGLVFSASLMMMTGLVGSASAAGFCCDPCSTVDCCDMPDYVLYADFLYWQTHEEGLAFARTGYNFATTPVDQQGKIYSPSCEWEPGFRIGAVVDLGCCEWDFYAQYTWMHSCNSSTAGRVDGATLEPMILSNVQASLTDLYDLQSARGNYELRFNVLDFGLGRTFNCNECFMLRPHFGFKATWQEHKYDVEYVQQDDPVTPTEINTNRIQQKMDFDGIGLRAGFDAAWKFSPCFSIVGNFAVSTVWSDLEIRRMDTDENNIVSGVITTETIANQKFDTCGIIPVIEMFLGVRWDSTVCDCYDTFVKVGWENQVWLDTNRFIREWNDTAGNHGNLTFQGLTVGAGLGF